MMIRKAKRHIIRFLSIRAKALMIGFNERRNENVSRTSLPVPPPLSRFRVHGALDLESYLRVGETCANDLKHLLALIDQNLYSFNNILDFGCGSGRVTRYFHNRPDSCHLYATDIDPQAISWCQKNLRVAQWNTNEPKPPTTYTDNFFDFIYAISVFTHLDEHMQFAWLRELKRVAKPGAILILSVHGEGARSKFSKTDRDLLSEKGFLFKVNHTGIFKVDGLPDFYQSTRHSRRYIEDKWSQLFKIVKYIERAINHHQDAVILQNL
jgi:SAM-dependent methyltransferase